METIKTIKALVLENYGQPYTMLTLSMSVAGKGEVLVKIKASGVNPLDLKIREGNAGHAKTKLPAVLGIDMAGIIEAVGEGVTSFKPGDEVFGMTGGIGGIQGSLAEYAAVDTELLALKPTNISFKEAAALPLTFITAWEGLVDRAKVIAGQTVLVHGGAGGVGNMAVQLANSFGAKIYATGSASQAEIIKGYNAIPIDYATETVTDYINKHTAGEGFDIVFDTIGGATLDASFEAVKIYTGHVLSILGWGTHSLASLSFRGATYSGVFTLMPLLTGKGRKHHGDILKEAAKLVERGLLKPIVDETHYTPCTIDKAYEAIENRKANGKVVIDIKF